MDSAPPASPSPGGQRAARFQSTLPRLRPLRPADAPGDGIIFAGNAHESVPRRLFLDTRLTPLERNAWQVIRLTVNEDGVTAFPSYQELRPFLASLPCSLQASDETIARALTVLRLTRWLSLARQRRDGATGRLQGNLYVLHDEPLSPYEALALDPDYLKLVSSSLTHASKTVQYLGFEVLKDFTDDPRMSGCVLPSRLDGLLERLSSVKGTERCEVEDPRGAAGPNPDACPAGSRHPQRAVQESGTRTHPFSTPSSESEERPPSSDSEEATKPLKIEALRNPKKDSTVRTVLYENFNNNIRTVPRARARVDLPERFARLRAEQQAGALAMLPQLDLPVQQAVLDEWDARCGDSSVRNPAGYLFGLIQRALRGQFHAWAARTVDRSDALCADEASQSPDPDSRRVQAQQQIAELKRLLAIRR